MKFPKLSLGFTLCCLVAASCSKPKPPAPEAVTEAPPTTEVTPAPAPEVPPAPLDANVSLDTVYFDFDSYSLTGAAQDTLRRMAAGLKGTGTKIQVEGHADERGSNEYNIALGERRAKAVQEFLVSEGVAAANVSTISYGEERPSAQGSDESAWSKNRRAEFKRM